MPRDRDAVEVEALLTDRYLDSLLSARDEGPVPVSAFGPGLTGLDRGVRIVSLRLQRDLPGFRPSTAFEERLALRLAQAAATLRISRAAGTQAPEDAVTPPAGAGAQLAHLIPGDPPAARGRSLAPRLGSADRSMVRPVLISGAVASAALSVVAATVLARRRHRQAQGVGAGAGLVRQLVRPGRILGELAD